MQNANSSHQDTADAHVTLLRSLMIMAGWLLTILVAVASPLVYGETLLAVLLYGKPVKKVFEKNWVVRI